VGSGYDVKSEINWWEVEKVVQNSEALEWQSIQIPQPLPLMDISNQLEYLFGFSLLMPVDCINNKYAISFHLLLLLLFGFFCGINLVMDLTVVVGATRDSGEIKAMSRWVDYHSRVIIINFHHQQSTP